MRVIWLVPLVAAFGCAHQSATSAESAPPEQAAATTAPSPAPKEPVVAEKTPSPAPAQLACAPVRVHFALDSDKLFDSEKPLLDVTARCLSDHDTQKVTIVGNADERGSQAYNMELGQRRAQAVAQYLESKGAAPAQVEAVISHGKDSPICRASTLQCWQLNRRTAIRESCHL
jgi:peptidoglycan-associated lipoprotein